jgi:hypothetical protein
VLAVAGWRYFDWPKQQATAALGARFDAAIQQLGGAQQAQGLATLEEMSKGEPGMYRIMAQMRAAAETAKRDAPAALKVLDGLTADAALDPTFRDIARLRAAALATDLEPLADLERRVQPLISGTNPWRHHAFELIAAAAMKVDNKERARQVLDQIILDRDAPAGVRARAELLIGLTR